MADSRRGWIVGRLSVGRGEVAGARRMCELAVELTAVSGAGIMLCTEEGPQGSLATTDAVAAAIENLQYTLGEGPCVDAHLLGAPVAEPELAGCARWPAFAAAAVRSGAGAVFSFPLRSGVARLGALDLYRDRGGALSDDQHADTLVLADVAAEMILAHQAGAPPGAVAAALADGADFRLVVHQAAGMASVQLGIEVGEALARLRSYAFRTDRLVADVARDVIDRVVRFDDA